MKLYSHDNFYEHGRVSANKRDISTAFTMAYREFMTTHTLTANATNEEIYETNSYALLYNTAWRYTQSQHGIDTTLSSLDNKNTGVFLLNGGVLGMYVARYLIGQEFDGELAPRLNAQRAIAQSDRYDSRTRSALAGLSSDGIEQYRNFFKMMETTPHISLLPRQQLLSIKDRIGGSANTVMPLQIGLGIVLGSTLEIQERLGEDAQAIFSEISSESPS